MCADRSVFVLPVGVRASMVRLMDRTRWWDWVQRLMDERALTPAGLSALSGVDQSVIGRWRDKGAVPSPDNVRKIAHALDQSVRQAAVMAGHYTAKELAGDDEPAVVDPETVDLVVISDERFGAEALRRMRSGSIHGRPSTTRRRSAAAAKLRPMAGHSASVVGTPNSTPNGTPEPEGAR